MIEIRPARPDELPRIKELWGLAFGDDDAFIERFFALAGGETLLLFEDGVAWTMTVLLPVTVTLPDGGMASSAYVYALCTHPEAREKGYGRFLLSYVDFYCKEKGLDCLTIVPAEPSLHRYFAANGFAECFSTRKVELLREMTAPPHPDDRLEPVEPGEYNRLRESLLAGTLHVSYGGGLLDLQRFFGQPRGGLWKLTVDGAAGLCAVECPDEDTIVAKELILPPEQVGRAAALLARQWPVRRYHLRTPSVWEGLSGSYLQNFGMVKWYDPELECGWREERKGYMGLGFD